MGVAVFFITGRPAELREATERNLRQEGYKPTGVILQAPGATFKSAADFKTPEHEKSPSRVHIVLNMGDQESDLLGGYAEKTFKLPNPVLPPLRVRARPRSPCRGRRPGISIRCRTRDRGNDLSWAELAREIQRADEVEAARRAGEDAFLLR